MIKAYNSRVISSWLADESQKAHEAHPSNDRIALTARCLYNLHAWYCNLEKYGRYLTQAALWQQLALIFRSSGSGMHENIYAHVYATCTFDSVRRQIRFGTSHWAIYRRIWFWPSKRQPPKSHLFSSATCVDMVIVLIPGTAFKNHLIISAIQVLLAITPQASCLQPHCRPDVPVPLFCTV